MPDLRNLIRDIAQRLGLTPGAGTTDDVKQSIRNSASEKMPGFEKQELWNSIESRIQATGKEKRVFHISRIWKAAAVLILLAGVGTYFYLSKPATPGLVQFAGTLKKDYNGNKQTLLLLNDKTSNNISGVNAELEVERNGGGITVNKEQKLTGATAEGYNSLIVPYGRRASMVLSDGTKVWLNAGSTLVFPTAFTGGKREVFAEGEVFFEVMHNADKPFHVYASDMNVRVTGTSFNVRAYQDEAEASVVLQEGSVSIGALSKTTDPVLLTPGRRAVFVPKTNFSKVTDVNVETYISWKEGYLHLKSTPLSEVLKTLSRYYNISITVSQQEVASKTFSGELNLQQSPEEVLKVICLTSYLKAEKIKEGNYRLDPVTPLK